MQVEKTTMLLDDHFQGTPNMLDNSKRLISFWILQDVESTTKLLTCRMYLHVLARKIIYVRHISCLRAQRMISALMLDLKNVSYDIASLFWGNIYSLSEIIVVY